MKKKRWMLKMGLAITVLLNGLPIWLVPQFKVSLDSWTMPLIWSLITLFMALIIQNWSQQKASQVAVWIGSGVMIAVFLRILFDSLFIDPMSHRLFLLELGIAYTIGMVTAAVGSYASQGLFSKNKSPKQAS
jgi:hypothetical protein